MSAKEEILLLCQNVSATDKRLFELKVKQNQVSKDLGIFKDELKLAEAVLFEYALSVVTMKSKDTDLVDLEKYRLAILAESHQKEQIAELKMAVANATKVLSAIDEMIPKLEIYKEGLKRDLGKYGKIERFPTKGNNESKDI